MLGELDGDANRAETVGYRLGELSQHRGHHARLSRSAGTDDGHLPLARGPMRELCLHRGCAGQLVERNVVRLELLIADGLLQRVAVAHALQRVTTHVDTVSVKA